jgi:stage II sporulation protein D
VARLELEVYVAWTVASETEPATPPEALRAQAVVARSYAVAAGRRHADVDLCDLAHCQLLRGDLAARHLAAARRAAEATRGEVLRLDSGRIALAPFHAACGGHTGDPSELFGGDGTGAAAVPDDGCPAQPWRTMVPAAVFEAVVAERLGAVAPPEALDWSMGRGGYVVQVALDGRVVGGEAFTRALDARLGHRSIRSSRFTATRTSRGVLFEGTGIGHGVGLCQAGAARRAAAGAKYRQILGHFFPHARIGHLSNKPI